MEASEVAGFFTSLGAAFCSRTAADDSCCAAAPLAVYSSDFIAMFAEHKRGTFTLPCGCGAQPLLSNAEGLRASTRQHCAHGVVYGELLLQPIACFEDLVVHASKVSPYGWYLRQVLSALLDRCHEFGFCHVSRSQAFTSLILVAFSAARDARRGSRWGVAARAFWRFI